MIHFLCVVEICAVKEKKTRTTTTTARRRRRKYCVVRKLRPSKWIGASCSCRRHQPLKDQTNGSGDETQRFQSSEVEKRRGVNPDARPVVKCPTNICDVRHARSISCGRRATTVGF